MSRKREKGLCENCRQNFDYIMIHNGFNESAYVYCGSCGETCLLNVHELPIPKSVSLPDCGIISEQIETLLNKCACGGEFKIGAAPRCPHCRMELSADRAAAYIEAEAPEAVSGWRWQRNWTGLYCIVIEDKKFYYDWKKFQHSATWISGPRHNWLCLGFTNREKNSNPPIFELPPQGECRHTPLQKDAILDFALQGVEKANHEFQTDFRINYLKYIANDTPPETRYAALAYQIIKRLVSGIDSFEAGR